MMVQKIENLAQGVAIQQIATKAKPLGNHGGDVTAALALRCYGILLALVLGRIGIPLALVLGRIGIPLALVFR